MRDNRTEFKSLGSGKTLPVFQSIGGASTQTNRWYPSSVTILVSITLVVVALIKLALLIRERYERHKIFDKGNIPSVGRKNPFSGNLFEVFKPKNITFILRDYHDKLGKNYGVFYGPDPWLISMDLKLLYKVMVVDANKHTDYGNLRVPYVDEFSKSLFQAKGSEWRRVRRLLNPSFVHKQMKSDNVAQAIERICERMLACIAGYPVEASGSGGHIVDVQYLFQMFTIETIFKVAYGRDNATSMSPDAKDEFIKGLHELSQVIMSPAMRFCIMFETFTAPFGYLTPLTAIGRMLRILNSKFDDCLEARQKFFPRKEGEEGGPYQSGEKLLVDVLAELRDGNMIDSVTLKANMIMMFLAGFETTANSLTTMLWLLARHQNIQEKLRQAVRIEGEEASYLDWCIKESMRLYPAVPVTGRVLAEDILTSEGQTIFKGTNLVPNIYSIYHSVEYWGQDVEEFRPERFGEPLEHPNQFISFGSGIRGCLGKNLAMVEMRAAITRILINFNVEFCNSTPDEIVWSGRNMIHSLIEGPINLKFAKLT